MGGLFKGASGRKKGSSSGKLSESRLESYSEYVVCIFPRLLMCAERVDPYVGRGLQAASASACKVSNQAYKKVIKHLLPATKRTHPA